MRLNCFESASYHVPKAALDRIDRILSGTSAYFTNETGSIIVDVGAFEEDVDVESQELWASLMVDIDAPEKLYKIQGFIEFWH